MALLRNTLLLLSTIGSIFAAGLCPIYGPVFPPAAKLSTSSTWLNASAQLRSTLEAAFVNGTTPHGPVSPKDTYSIQVFSTNGTIFEYYHKGSNLAASGIYGVDGDSVYRVGSVSKLYAVYLLLVVAGDRVFSDPMVRYIPELEGLAHWNDVTVGALAGQVGGVVTDCKSSVWT